MTKTKLNEILKELENFDKIDEIFPPFSEKRRNARKEWEQLKDHHNWKEYLNDLINKTK